VRRSVMAALASLLLLAWPAHAQLFPTNPGVPPAPDGDRVLVDAALYVTPPRAEGLCMTIPAGRVTVTTSRTQEATEPRPARFTLLGFMIDPDVRVEIPIGQQEVTTTAHVNGIDRYCWDVTIDAPETEAMPRAQRGAYVQRISIRILHRPE
jgi:hypothetical protein